MTLPSFVLVPTFVRNWLALLFAFLALPPSSNGQGPQTTDSDPFSFHATIQGGLFRNFAGGIDQGNNFIGKTNLILTLDTEAAGLWKNGMFLVNGVNMLGGNTTLRYVGDFQPISRNEATPERTGLFELWYKHTMGRAFILVGQHDMNRSFGTSRYAGNSINSAFGMNPSLTPNAGYSFSIFPRTMPGIYFAHEGIRAGKASIALHAAVYAGASAPLEEDRYNVRWNLDQGSHSRFEAHYIGRRGSYKLGFMYHSGMFPSVLNDTDQIDGNMGVYFIADQQLTTKDDDENGEGLGLFVQLGTAPGDQNLVRSFASVGINYTGPFAKRNEDVLFVGLLNSALNQDLTEQTRMDKNRTILEVNYAFKFGKNFTLQPDLQYIINPGANPDLQNSLLGILRFTLTTNH